MQVWWGVLLVSWAPAAALYSGLVHHGEHPRTLRATGILGSDAHSGGSFNFVPTGWTKI